MMEDPALLKLEVKVADAKFMDSKGLLTVKQKAI